MRRDPASLKELMLLSWLVPGALAVVLSLASFLIAGGIDYRNVVQRTTFEIGEKSKVAARRLSAELLLGQSGAVESVSRVLEGELEVERISVQYQTPSCLSQGAEFCSIRTGGRITAYRTIPGLSDTHFVVLSDAASSYWGSVRPKLLLWSTLPVLLLIGLGLLVQRALLRKYVQLPIEALVETTLHRDVPPSHWPEELKEIAGRLKESFEAREQAVFGQLARGVVHDIKTLLHSMGTAADMAKEQPQGSYKRAVRLEALLRAATTNLPKMKHIIEQTLDGSRDIPIEPRTQDLVLTIQNALEVNREFATSREVTVSYEGPSSLLARHDPVQIERALINIIKNGIEAQEEWQERERALRVSLAEDADGAAFVSIEDAGPGLTQEPGLVFRPLRSAKRHGSGLGLSISRKIVESHAGTIRAGKSDTLSGARFDIRLPATERGLA
jgi:signal transduction histidine kinase